MTRDARRTMTSSFRTRGARGPAIALILSAFAIACGGPGARAPASSHADLPAGFARAFLTDMKGAPEDAVKAYLALADVAAQSDADPWQVPALEASLDALATRSMPSLDDASEDAALAYRTALGKTIAAALVRSASEARGPFARGLFARALGSMAEHRGDVNEAKGQRAASGCVQQALVVGPVSLRPVGGVAEVGPLDHADARLEAAYPAPGAFDTPLHPVTVEGRGCGIALSAESARPGVREVIVDVVVPRAETLGLVLRAHGAANLRAGGTVVLQRPFELGDGEAAQFARVAATPGLLRLVARVGTAKDDDSVEIDAFDENGDPLRAQSPAVGSVSSGRVHDVEAIASPTTLAPSNEDHALLSAAAQLAAGDPHDAEHALWAVATQARVRPDLAMVYARAVEMARDLSAATRAERERTAYERVLDVVPGSWEATVAHAVLAGVRRGRDEAGLEELRDLDTLAAKANGLRPSVVDAFDAIVSGNEHLFDRAQAALARIQPTFGETSFFADAKDASSPRVGPDLSAEACDRTQPNAHDTMSCFVALRRSGDRAGQARELARLRDLLGAPRAFLPLELREALVAGDTATAQRASAAMLPGQRTLSALAILQSGSPDLRARLLQLAVSADDAPAAIAPLRRAASEDTTGELDAQAEALAEQDRAHPILPSAATAVLVHTERYEISAEGLLHWLLFDVRRVSGTTDVEDNAQAAAPDVWGRGSTRALRRRILKKDGRIIEPDRAPRASQAHADLSQLEQGDLIEAVYEGYALPSDTGDVGIDTPDLFPARTAVHDATIELRVPRALRSALWSHALLGKASERLEGSNRVLTWHVTDLPARRVEDGVPRMDRNVGVSFSSAEWNSVAQALRETVAELDEHDPEIGAWARDAVANAGTSPRKKIDALVVAAGKALREADADTLSDFGGGASPVQAQTARTFLTSHSGSRAWLVLRSLRELGIGCDLVVSENDPYSADPRFPPHFGRFVHPLVVAHVPAETGAPGAHEDVWIDADVAGPPLPAGRISPELRGRLALRTDGSIAPLPGLGSGEDERDEVDTRLALDAQGNARGTFAIVLRGRDAQQLAEALFRIVGADRQRALRDVVLAWLPWANVDDVALSSTEGSWQVGLRANVSVSGYAQAEGDKTWLLPGLDPLHWAWPRARVSSLAAAYATRAGRESALAVSSAVQYHVHRRVDLPPGAIVARMPGPLEVKSKLVEASRKMSVSANALEDDFILGVSTGTIAAGDYDGFVTAAHTADDGFLASTRISVVTAGPTTGPTGAGASPSSSTKTKSVAPRP